MTTSKPQGEVESILQPSQRPESYPWIFQAMDRSMTECSSRPLAMIDGWNPPGLDAEWMKATLRIATATNCSSEPLKKYWPLLLAAACACRCMFFYMAHVMPLHIINHAHFINVLSHSWSARCSVSKTMSNHEHIHSRLYI